MGWNSITEDERIIPGGGGNQNEVILEAGKPVRVRLLLGENEEPYSYFEHAIEAEVPGENGTMNKIFRTVRCMKTSDSPYADCPLCNGQQIRRRVRNVSNVWDYTDNKVKKLSQGEQIWKPIATSRKMGIDVLGVDWALMRSGKDRNDTSYSATNLGPTPFIMTAEIAAQLANIRQDYAPPTIEEMRQTVESCGLDWDTVTVPPQIQYNMSLEQALNHQMPNGKHKGKTMKQLWDEDKTARGMINFLAMKSDRITDEKVAARIIMVNLGGANIEGVPRFNGGTVTYNSAPAQTSAPVATPAPAPAPIPTTPVAAPVAPTAPPAPTVTAPQSSIPTAPHVSAPAPSAPSAPPSAPAPNAGRDAKMAEVNKEFSTNPKFVNGGFSVVMDTIKKVGNGKTNITDFSDAELDTLLSECRS